MNIADRLKQTFTGKRASSRFTGDFKSWEEAERKSTGYSVAEILEKTRAALLKVKTGEAAFERDGMPFATMKHDFSLLAGLLRAAATDRGRLNVLDFGGSLGGTYFQCREFLSPVGVLRWSVVDQPGHVACGKADFANEELRFYGSIAECLREPYAFLEDVLREGIPYVIVERTAFNNARRDRLTIQHVPPWLYNAIFPAWFLSEPLFRAAFEEKYDLVCAYVSKDHAHLEGGKALFKGFHFEHKTTAD